MNTSEYRRLVGVIDAYLRHEPHRFRDAATWVRSHRAPKPKDTTSPRARYGYSGFELRTFECMWVLARAFRDQLHGPSALSQSDPELQAAEAFRVLLVAWLLSPDAALASVDLKIRPTGMGPLPLLTVEQTMRIAGKYKLSASPRWRALVRAAWNRVGDAAYLEEHNASAPPRSPPVVAEPPQIKKPRRPKPCEARAYFSHLLIVRSSDPLVGTGKTTYSKAQFNHIREFGSLAYPDEFPCPDDYKRWSTYVRHGLAYFEPREGTPPPLSELAAILKLDSRVIRNLPGTGSNP